MRKLFIGIVAFMLFAILLPAKATENIEDIEVRGCVVDTNNVPIFQAQIQITIQGDTAVTWRTTSDRQGQFCIRIAKGAYQVRVSCIGYHMLTYQMECLSDIDLKDLKLIEQTLNIGEVTVTARRVTFNSKGYSFNIQNEPLYKDNTLVETLALMPGLSLKDGIFEAYHEKILSVFINNKKIRLPMESIIQTLSAYESKNIRSIEVLNSTADPEESTKIGYVIKITTNSIDDGGQMTAGISDVIGNTQENTVTPSLSIQQRWGKWSLFLAPNWTPCNQLHRNRNSHTFYYDTQRERDEFSMWAMSFKPRLRCTASLAYDFNERQSLIFSASGQHFIREHNTRTYNNLREAGNTVKTEGLTILSTKTNGINASLDYNATFNQLTLMTSVSYSAQNQQSFNSMKQTKQGSPSALQAIGQDVKFRVGLFTVLGTWHIDDIQGATLILKHINWNNCTENVYMQQAHEDNTFKLTEQIYSALATYTYKKGAVDLNVGLEYIHDRESPEFTYITTSVSHKRNYSYLLPSATLTLTASQKKDIYATLQYTRKYGRPNFSQYDSNITYNSEYSYTKGYSDIAPDVTDEVRLQAQFCGWAVYGISTFATSPTTIYGVDEKGLEYTSYGNDSHSTVLYAGIATPRISPCKGWSLTASAYYQWDRTVYQNHVMHANRVGMDFTSTNKLPLNVTMTLRGDFMTRYYTLYGYSSSPGDVSLKLSRSWLKRALTTSFSATYRCLTKNVLMTDTYLQDSRYTKPIVQFAISLRYQFSWGNRKVQAKKKTQIDSELLRMD